MEQETPAPEIKISKKSLVVPIIIIAVGLLGLAGVFIFRLGRNLSLNKATELTPTPTEEAAPSPTSEISTSPAPSPTRRPTARPTVTPTPTPQLTSTPTPEPTATSTPTPTSTPTSTPEPQADLYISEYSYNHPPKMGEAFTVKIGIYNKGNKAAGGFWWEWWATTSAPSPACRERIDSLAAHGGRIVYCTYTYGGWANYTVKAVADVDNEVSESDEGNNAHVENLIPIH